MKFFRSTTQAWSGRLNQANSQALPTTEISIARHNNLVSSIRATGRYFLITSLVTMLAACGGSGGDGGDDADTSAPTAHISFPPPVSATEGGSVTLRGTTSDASEVTVVRVNGVDATSTDNFATWDATVDLSPGLNTLTVETGDIALNGAPAAASVQIEALRAEFRRSGGRDRGWRQPSSAFD